jgi:hypothetical protein
MSGSMPVGGMKRSTKLPVGDSEAVAPIACRSEISYLRPRVCQVRALERVGSRKFSHSGSDIANLASSVDTVPMTPSITRAVGRIVAAQAQASRTSSGSVTSTGGREADMESILARKQKWEVFWRDVTAKASEGAHFYLSSCRYSRTRIAYTVKSTVCEFHEPSVLK